MSKNDPSEPKPQAGAANSDRPILRPRTRPGNPDTDIKGKKGKKSSLPVSTMTSTPIKSPLKSELKKCSPILSQFTELVSREGGKGPLTNLPNSSSISSSMLSTSALPEPIHDAVLLIHEELNETKRSLQVLRSNAQHLLLSPENVISGLETCIANVEKLHDMLSVKFDQLDCKINSLTPSPDPTEGILKGVEALLMKLPTPPAPQPPTENAANTGEILSQLMRRMDKLEASCSKTSSTSNELLGRTKTFLDNLEKERDTLTTPSTLPTPHSPLVTKPYVSLIQFDGLTSEQLQAVDEYLKTVKWKKVKGGRELWYCGDCGYGYGPMNHPREPIPKALIPLVEAMNKANPGFRVNTILFTRYANGKICCPAHFDDEPELSPTDHILTWSRGPGSRCMRFTNVHTGDTSDLPLPDNSLLTVSRESQTVWKHEIPYDEKVVDWRESATFRMIEHKNRYHTRLYGDSNTGFIKFGNGPDTMGARFPGQRIRVPRVGDLPEPADVPPVPKIIFHVGINDLVDPVSPISCAEIARILDMKCAAITRRLPKTKILISPLLPTINHFLNEQVFETNRLILDVCSKYHNVIMMDNTPFKGPDNLLLEKFRGRRPENVVHLNGHGIRALKDLFKGYIVGRAAMRGMNYKSALLRGAPAENAGYSRGPDIDSRKFTRNDRSQIQSGGNKDVVGRPSGWLMGNGYGRPGGDPRSGCPRKFERNDKPDKKNPRFRPFGPRINSSINNRDDFKFRRIWDNSVNGFVEYDGSGTGISQSPPHPHHDGDK